MLRKFVKMEGAGNDYIYFDNRDGSITSPESLAIQVCDRHRGIGGDGIVLIEKSSVANAKMRIFNRDGSEGLMSGNCIRCVAKYLFDKKIVKKDKMKIETASGVKSLKVYTYGNEVRSVSVEMGKASLVPADVPVTLPGEKVLDYPAVIGGKEYRINCVSMGNPHCVVFCDRVDAVDVEAVGPQFENADIFPERVNAEFVRVVNRRTLKMRVWERGNGETLACGTGACAAVVAAVENGYCDAGVDITVKVRGGDLIVSYTPEGVTLTGETALAFEGTVVC